MADGRLWAIADADGRVDGESRFIHYLKTNMVL